MKTESDPKLYETKEAVPLTKCCLNCPMYGRGFENCVSFSWLHGGAKRNPEFIRYFLYKEKPVETEAMKRGLDAHGAISKSRKVVTNLKDVIESIVAGRRTVWSGFVCSPLHGYRGRPDAVISQLSKTDDGHRLVHYVMEDKKDRGNGYQLQVFGEAEVLANEWFLVHPQTNSDLFTEEPSILFYEELRKRIGEGKRLHVEIFTVLNYYGKEPRDGYGWILNGTSPDGLERPRLWSVDGVPLSWTSASEVKKAKRMRIGAIQRARMSDGSRQTRFTRSPRPSLKMVSEFPGADGTIGLFVPDE